MFCETSWIDFFENEGVIWHVRVELYSTMDFEALTKEELIVLLMQAMGRIEAQEEQIQSLQAAVVALQQQIDRLKGNPLPKTKWETPDFVQANAPKRQPKERKKRPHGFARPRSEPTEVIAHYPEKCSCCGRALCGGWLHSVREVIEIPEVKVQVIHHHLYARHCGVCNRREVASVDLSGAVLGQGRIGLRLMSLVAYLDMTARMPVELIQGLLRSLWGLSLSVGQICEILHKVAQVGKPLYEELLVKLRAGPFVNADETGWRENGKNGYAWSFSNPDLEYFVCQRNRSADVAKEVLGETFAGTLVSDFYSAYHWYLGRHQYCWPHLLREIHALKEKHPQDTTLLAFTEGVRKIYDHAVAFTNTNPLLRRDQRRLYEKQITDLAREHQGEERPERTLADRIVRRAHGLFTFVEHPEVPNNNNAAERSLRQLVVMRKVSGGTRSDAGSETVAVLMSLFSTWKRQALDTLDTCRQMLLGQLKPADT
jgi:transposase